MSATATAPLPVTVPPTDLTQRPPRSPRVRLGGFVVLSRTIDKARAKLAGTIGEYHYDCPLDNRLFSFIKITGDALLEQVALGKNDGQLLDWIKANAGYKPTDAEIAAWSAQQEVNGPSTPEAIAKLAQQIAQLAPHRTDIKTGFDRLDLDDHVSYGGKA